MASWHEETEPYWLIPPEPRTVPFDCPQCGSTRYPDEIPPDDPADDDTSYRCPECGFESYDVEAWNDPL